MLLKHIYMKANVFNEDSTKTCKLLMMMKMMNDLIN